MAFRPGRRNAAATRPNARAAGGNERASLCKELMVTRDRLRSQLVAVLDPAFTPMQGRPALRSIPDLGMSVPIMGMKARVPCGLDRMRESDFRSPYGEPRLMRPRWGQGAFRILVTDAYGRRCAVTREKALPVLQAAHIRPLSEGGVHSLDNGLLLRADVHALYDRGYVTVTPDLTFRASRRLKDDFDNGEHYFAMSGSRVWVPEDEASRPTPMWESRSFFSAIGWASTS